MKAVTLDDIEALAVGAWILGTGGGGSPYLGLLNMRRLYAEGHRVDLMDAADLAGWPEPTGVRATDDVDALLALGADACCYNPLWPRVDELVALYGGNFALHGLSAANVGALVAIEVVGGV